MPAVTVQTSNETRRLKAAAGENLLSVLQRGGIPVYAPCGGRGTCGKCTVLMTAAGKSRAVQACETAVSCDCEIYLRQPETVFFRDGSAEDARRFPAGGSGVGAAVDLGTTGVAVSLIDLSDGVSLGTLSARNAQYGYGADILSRAQYAFMNKNGVDSLSGIIRTQIFDMIGALLSRCGRQKEELRRVFAAGNTVMELLFAGLSPESTVKPPYKSAALFDDGRPQTVNGTEVFLSPCASAFIGGDITAGLLSVGESVLPDEKYLFLDVGTNGEMALWDGERFTACSVACGPAFEGAGISCGMPAEEGAVSRVRVSDGRYLFDVIGGGSPKGLCGSGLIDAVSCLVSDGSVTPDGKIRAGKAITLTGDAALTQKDIREVQLAKAAVRAGVDTLLEQTETDPAEIGTVFLAGGFGNRLDPVSAAVIGMLPAALVPAVRCVGNTCLSGAEQALLSESARRRLTALRSLIRVKELSGDPDFDRHFLASLNF